MDKTLSKLLDRTLDQHYGIFRYIKEIPLAPDEPDIFITIAEFQNPFKVSPEGLDRSNFKMTTQSAGAALDRESSLWSAIGEGIERYAGAIYDPELLYWKASEELDKDSFVHPNDFILFDKEQYNDVDFKYQPHDPTVEIGWAQAIRLSDQKRVYFPASLAYFAYKHKDRSEYLTDSYSTGLACGPTKEWAICSGLYEVIERDAYSLHWAAQQPAKKIDLQQAIEIADPDLRKLLTHPRVNLFIGEITNDIGVPTVIAIARHPEKSGVALGASTNLCIKTALKKAVIECFHTFNWCIDMHRLGGTINKEDVKGFSDHVLYYLQEENSKHASFFWSGEERSTLLDGLSSTSPEGEMNHKQQLQVLTEKLKKLNFGSYVIDMTPSDIASLGLYVTKSSIPGLQPMWCGYGRVPKDRRRFEQFLAYVGKNQEIPINEEIHPFP